MFPFTKQKILGPSKLKEFAEDNFRVNENGRKKSKRVENIAGKGQIACFKQFLLLLQCFERTVTQILKNQGLFGKGLNGIIKVIQTGRKHCGKRRNCSLKEQFLLFPQCFQKACFPGASKGVIVWEWVLHCMLEAFTTQSRLFKTLRSKAFLNLWEEEKMHGNLHFLPFLLTFSNTKFIF